jgi:hypothetical protein
MVNTRKKFGGNELALAGAVKEDLACSGSSPLNKSDQVISLRAHDGECERASWSGPQASSDKLQASSFRTNLSKHQATSVKPQAASFKRQATSGKLPDPRTTVHGYWRSIRG